MARARAFGLVGSAAGALALALFGSVGCVDGNVPPRPAPTFGPPKQLVSAPGCGDLAIAVSGGTLFWTEAATGAVKSMPIAGDAITVLATDQRSPGTIGADATSVFWIVNQRSIAKVARAGGAVEVVVSESTLPIDFGGENDVNALLVVGQNLYFARFTSTFLIPTAGGAPTRLGLSPMEDLGQPTAVAVDGTFIYLAEDFHNAVTRVRLDGLQEGKLESGSKARWAPDRIAVSQGSLLLEAIARWGEDVIWANGATILRKASSANEKVPFVRVASTLGDGDVSGFVVSGSSIYFGEEGSDLLQRVTLPSGAPTVVATGQSNPRRFVADGDAVYWRNDDCTVMRLPTR